MFFPGDHSEGELPVGAVINLGLVGGSYLWGLWPRSTPELPPVYFWDWGVTQTDGSGPREEEGEVEAGKTEAL